MILRKFIYIFIFLATLSFLQFFASTNSFAQGTFSCHDLANNGTCSVGTNSCDTANGWQPDTSKCTALNGNPAGCDALTSQTCMRPAQKYACVSNQCVACTSGPDCTFFSLTACDAGCTAAPVQPPTNPGGGPSSGSSGGGVDIGSKFGSPFGVDKTLGDLVSLIIQIAFVLSGLIILFMFLFAGYSVLAGAGNNDPQQAAKGRTAATGAVLGFIVVFVAYWIVRLIEAIIGVDFITNLLSG